MHIFQSQQFKANLKQLSQFIVMDSWAILGRLSPPPFRNVSSVSSLLSVFCLLSLTRSFVLLICNLNIILLDRPSSLATLADFFLVGFTLIVLSISSCSWSKFSLFWNSFCHRALISDSKATLSDCSFSHLRIL